MEYRLLTPEDTALLMAFVDDQHTRYEPEQIISFLKRDEAYAFIAIEEKIVGFAYGYVLHRPDGQKDFYLHAVDVTQAMQGKGYGTELVRFIDGWRKSEGCRKMFLSTNKRNTPACKCYQNAGGTNPADDDVIYVFQ